MVIPIIIPAYEPDERLLDLLADLKAAGETEIILVNDGSGIEYNNIFAVAEEKFNCQVITHSKNCGKGRALKNAFFYCLDHYNDMLGCVTADSDGQHTVDSIRSVKQLLIDNPNALSLGVRDFSRGENIPAKSQIGNNLSKTICKYLCGLDITDTQTGLRGIPESFMRECLNIKGERFEFETQMLIQTVGKMKIVETPIETIYDSVDHHSTHFNPVVDTFKIFKIFGLVFIKYVFSSLSSSVIDLVVFYFLNYLLIHNVSGFRYNVIVATVIARILSATYNYVINYIFVFGSKKRIKTSAVKYFGLACVQMLISAIVAWLLSLAHFAPDVVIKGIVDCVLFFVSYYIQRKFVF